jgi:cytidine deaminase
MKSSKSPPAKLTPAVARQLVEAARKVRRRAYAPYSNFHVGAALLGASGRIHVGFNVENISYGLSVCAERTALFSALITGEENFVALAVATDSPDPVMPCGACRQVLREFSADLPVLVAPRTGAVVRRRLDKLIPEAFFSFPGSGKKGGR